MQNIDYHGPLLIFETDIGSDAVFWFDFYWLMDILDIPSNSTERKLSSMLYNAVSFEYYPLISESSYILSAN